MSTQANRGFNRRAFASLVMALSSIGLLVSGLTLIGPPGHGSGAERMHSWTHVHLAYAAIFVGFTVWHVAMNWRVLLNHLRSAKSAAPSISREAVYAAAVLAALTLLVAFHGEG